MAAGLVSFLSALSSKVFWFATVCFILINGAALVAFFLTRSRRLVDEWTPRLLAADTLLIGAGLGVPLASGLAKLGVQALASMLGGAPPTAP
jgi:hypothetical protein